MAAAKIGTVLKMSNITKLSSDYYFVFYSDDGLCPKWLYLKPRKPRCRAITEPKTKRICVAPSVSCCLLSIAHALEMTRAEQSNRVFTVYLSLNNNVVEPCDVLDSKSTKEKWLTTPSEFRRMFTLPNDMLIDIINSIKCATTISGRHKESVDIKNLAIIRKKLKEYIILDKP